MLVLFNLLSWVFTFALEPGEVLFEALHLLLVFFLHPLDLGLVLLLDLPWPKDG